MKHEIKKISKIVDEIITYFVYELECSTLELRYEGSETACILDFSFHGIELSRDAFNQLRRALRGDRQPELEDYYWQLMGNTEESGALALVSMMVDNAELKYEGDTIRLSLRRNW